MAGVCGVGLEWYNFPSKEIGWRFYWMTDIHFIGV